MQRFASSIRGMSVVLGAIWLAFLLQHLFHLEPGRWGIVPRHPGQLKGILTAPLLHASWSHLTSNSAPLLILTFLLFHFYQRIAWLSLGMIHVLTGLAVWLLARGSAAHIGASGVVYGLAAFIFCNGLFRRDLKSISLLLLVTGLYSGLLYGVLPSRPGISWESHLLGFFAGAGTAYLLRGQGPMPTDPFKTAALPARESPDRAQPAVGPDAFERALKAALEKKPDA